jgi:hypothetical protein
MDFCDLYMPLLNEWGTWGKPIQNTEWIRVVRPGFDSWHRRRFFHFPSHWNQLRCTPATGPTSSSTAKYTIHFRLLPRYVKSGGFISTPHPRYLHCIAIKYTDFTQYFCKPFFHQNSDTHKTLRDYHRQHKALWHTSAPLNTDTATTLNISAQRKAQNLCWSADVRDIQTSQHSWKWLCHSRANLCCSSHLSPVHCSMP